MIIIGLGNPGAKYDGTRHNVGFVVVETVAQKLDLAWSTEFGVRYARSGQHWLLEPQEFMNVSGQTVVAFCQKKHIAINPVDVLVIHDDLDFPLGELHSQRDRSAGGHNGVQSVIDALGTKAFQRLRIGIGNNRDLNIPAEDYVLQKFSATESAALQPAITQAAETVQALLTA
jgi:PTH1 family peptidyl-tRNA hydrolase